jgi:hypothetical protein
MLAETSDSQGFRVGRLLDKIGRKAQDTADRHHPRPYLPRSTFPETPERRFGFCRCVPLA